MTGKPAGLVETRLTPRSAADRDLPVLPEKRTSHHAAIVHLGLSNFHRAHQAICTAQALDLEEGPWGIVGVPRQSQRCARGDESSRPRLRGPFAGRQHSRDPGPPGTPGADRKLVEAQSGLIDACPVPAEPFSMWVMEDHFATAHPCWDRVGAIVSDEVHGFEILKIRLLNGTHSLIAYLGMLIGARTIDEAIADSDVRGAVEAFLDEMAETLQPPAGISLEDYRASLLRRFGILRPVIGPVRSVPTAP